MLVTNGPALEGVGAERLAASRRRIVVTGTGGWLGLATLELLTGLLGDEFEGRVVCFGARARSLRLRGGVAMPQAPLAALGDLPAMPSVVLHLAFLTQGPAMTLDAEGYVAANQAISATVLRALDRIGAEAVFQASSGAARLADPAGGPQSKGLYGWLKARDEEAFAAWGRAAGRTAVIGRVFNLSGPYINRRSTYALASFIADVQAGRPIEIRATHRVWRSYVSIRELMSVVLGALAEPARGELRFETAGDAVVEMGDLAQAVTGALAPGTPIHRAPLDAGAADDCYVGDGAAFTGLARAFGVAPVSLTDQIRETAAYMAQCPEAG